MYRLLRAQDVVHVGTSFLLAWVFLACQGEPSRPTGRLELAVAPLDLDGASDVTWQLATWNGLGQLVFATSPLKSSRYGDGAGGNLTWIGACDASAPAHKVKVVLTEILLDTDGDGLPTASDKVASDYVNPCPGPISSPTAGCILNVECLENQDTRVDFSITVLRSARQGFFDVAVAFSDVFCSAKFDTCREGNVPIELLHGDDGTRDWTGVVALACTAGPGSATELLLSHPRLVCDGAAVPLEVRGGPGNVIHDVAGLTFHTAIYRGAEALTCGGVDCQKRYWNLALSLEDLAEIGDDCHLVLSATVSDATEPFATGLPVGKGIVRGYIDYDLDLVADGAPLCQRHALSDAGPVRVAYHGDVGGLTSPPRMCSRFDGASVSKVETQVCPYESSEDPPVVTGLIKAPTLIAGTGPAFTCEPSIAYNPEDDEFLVAWQDVAPNANFTLMLQRVDGDGTLIGSPIEALRETVRNAGGADAGSCSEPRVAYNAVHDRYLLTWHSGGGGSASMQHGGSMALFGRDGTRLGPEAATGAGGQRLFAPGNTPSHIAAVGRTGDWLMLAKGPSLEWSWFGGGYQFNGYAELHGRFIPGTALAPVAEKPWTFDYSTSGYGRTGYSSSFWNYVAPYTYKSVPSLAHDNPDQSFVWVWGDSRHYWNTPTIMVMRRYDEVTSAFEDETVFGAFKDHRLSSQPPRLALGRDAGQWMFVSSIATTYHSGQSWLVFPNREVYGLATGATPWIVIDEVGHYRGANVTYDPRREKYLVIWRDFTNGSQLYLRRYRLDGTPEGAREAVTMAPGFATDAAIASRRNGSLIAWMGLTTPGLHVAMVR